MKEKERRETKEENERKEEVKKEDFLFIFAMFVNTRDLQARSSAKKKYQNKTWLMKIMLVIG